MRAPLLIALALVIAYTFHRAIALRTDYYDAYAYLESAKRLAGSPSASYHDIRPPLIPLLQAPFVALASTFGPANVGYLILPHLCSALLSVGSLAVAFVAYRRAFGITLGLLGVVLVTAQRLFVRYGAHAMVDIPAMGLTTLAFLMYVRARERASWRSYAVLGVAIGAGILTKHVLALIPIALLGTEAIFALRSRRFDPHSWRGVGFATLLGVFIFGAVEGSIFASLYGEDFGLRLRRVLIENGLRGHILTSHGSESWIDYGPMLSAVFPWPVLLLSAVGLGIAVARTETRDVPFLAWIAVVGGGVVFFVTHTEARYLLPAIPALTYFALRGLIACGGHVPARVLDVMAHHPIISRGALGAVVSLGLGYTAVHQVWLDQDPMFTHDMERTAGAMLLEGRAPGTRFFWLGTTSHARFPSRRIEIDRDQFFNTLHITPFAVSYFIDEPITPLASSPWTDVNVFDSLTDGDRILRVGDVFYTSPELPSSPEPPLQIWEVERRDLRRPREEPAGFTRVPSTACDFLSEDTKMCVHSNGSVCTLTLQNAADRGAWRVLGSSAREAPRVLGEVLLERTTILPFGRSALDALDRLSLLRVAPSIVP